MTLSALRVAMTVEQCWQPVPGGSGTYIAQLTHAFAAQDDLRVVGLTARHDGQSPDPDFTPTLDALVSAPWPRPVLYELWNRAGRPRAEQLAARTGQIDVVHATTWAVPPTRAPLVVTIHDLAFLTDPAMFTPRGVRYFRRALDRVRHEADRIIVPSRATLEACVSVGLPESTIRVVPHGVTMPAVDVEEIAEFRRTNGLTRPYVLWCGTLEPRKNVRGVLEGFAAARSRLPGHDLVLVGPAGWGDQLDDAHDPSDASVHWLGKLTRADLARAYAGADALCYPSFAEGFGLPALEAMAYGVPVVTSTGTPMAELVGATGAVVDPTDTDAIAAGLVAVIADRDVLSPAATARAGEFSWDSAAASTRAVYAELC